MAKLYVVSVYLVDDDPDNDPTEDVPTGVVDAVANNIPNIVHLSPSGRPLRFMGAGITGDGVDMAPR